MRARWQCCAILLVGKPTRGGQAAVTMAWCRAASPWSCRRPLLRRDPGARWPGTRTRELLAVRGIVRVVKSAWSAAASTSSRRLFLEAIPLLARYRTVELSVLSSGSLCLQRIVFCI